jgi:xanthosine utilization system XapX-like protein
MMLAQHLAFVAMAINPIGGLLIAIPFAVLKLDYPPWLALLAGVPLAYVQVLVIDLGWTTLARWPRWSSWLERRRSPRVNRLVESRGSFWLTLLLSPLIGPWLVMAFMRYARVPQRRVALPILLGLSWTGTLITLATVWAPRLLPR